ncbi:hypothetical protein MtrunA17_Chr2g0310811 [Medicago truncatula]|uniref:Transmembrane protein n=1 Tax=Medicago truncatula TaxID=3880 RepID=A0A396JB05_MEDTR|nr:hypothetical protein MtrunA17_Chr2g0310811 [Medicago truncatula]
MQGNRYNKIRGKKKIHIRLLRWSFFSRLMVLTINITKTHLKPLFYKLFRKHLLES